MKYLTTRINDSFVLQNKNLTLFQACLEKKIFLPRFCFHKKLNIAGNCRMCLIEEKQSSKLIVSCASDLSNGLIINTKTKIIKKAREAILEYLLINHPLDCPICDQGGECDLQDQTNVFGGDKSRFYELVKLPIEKKNLNYGIKMFLNRCIYCGRCTRYLNLLINNFSLRLLGRGEFTEISNNLKFSKVVDNLLNFNIIDLCPVGALLSKPYSFNARSWEIVSISSISLFDSFGSNIQIDFQGTKILRILPKINSFLNEEWICDRTRFFYDSVTVQRLLSPMLLLKKNFSFFFKNISWLGIFNFLNNYLNYYFKILNNFNIKFFNLNCFFGPFLDFESLIYSKYFFKKFSNTFFFKNQTSKLNFDFRRNYIFNFPSFFWKSSNCCIFINTNLRLENPILYLKLLNVSKLKFFFFLIIGFRIIIDKNFLYLGNNSLNLIKIFEFYFLSFNKYSSPFILLNETINFNLEFLKDFSKFFNINLISNNASSINIAELNLISNKSLLLYNKSNFLVNYFLGYDDFNFNFNFLKNSLIIYQGQHGDYITNLSDVILPSKSYIEKSSTFINLEGWVQETKSTIFRYDFDKIKNDYIILKSLSEYLFSFNFNKNSINISNFLNFNKFFSKFNSNFILIIELFENLSLKIFKTNKLKIFNKNFNSIINYFQNNSKIRFSKNLNFLTFPKNDFLKNLNKIF